MRMGFRCWKCGERATAIKMKTISPTLVEAGYQCRNIDCGHTFVVAIEAIRTLSPGAYPNPPGINVPISSHVRRNQLAVQIDRTTSAVGGSMTGLPEPGHVAQIGLFADGVAIHGP